MPALIKIPEFSPVDWLSALEYSNLIRSCIKQQPFRNRGTAHDVEIERLLREDPSLFCYGFASHMTRLVARECCSTIGETSRDYIDCPSIIPDCFKFSYKDKLVTVIEVEDTCRVSKRKLEELSIVWFTLDSYCWELELHRVNCYGGVLQVVRDDDDWWKIHCELSCRADREEAQRRLDGRA